MIIVISGEFINHQKKKNSESSLVELQSTFKHNGVLTHSFTVFSQKFDMGSGFLRRNPECKTDTPTLCQNTTDVNIDPIDE
jgi:hypothetical protein